MFEDKRLLKKTKKWFYEIEFLKSDMSWEYSNKTSLYKIKNI